MEKCFRRFEVELIVFALCGKWLFAAEEDKGDFSVPSGYILRGTPSAHPSHPIYFWMARIETISLLSSQHFVSPSLSKPEPFKYRIDSSNVRTGPPARHWKKFSKIRVYFLSPLSTNNLGGKRRNRFLTVFIVAWEKICSVHARTNTIILLPTTCRLYEIRVHMYVCVPSILPRSFPVQILGRKETVLAWAAH